MKNKVSSLIMNKVERAKFLDLDEKLRKQLESYDHVLPIFRHDYVGNEYLVVIRAEDCWALLRHSKLIPVEFCVKCGSTDIILRGRNKKGHQQYHCKRCKKWMI